MGTSSNISEQQPKRRRPMAPLISLNQPGRLRFANLMALFGISHQTLYKRMKEGVIPQPDGHDGPHPFWYTATIRPLLEKPQLQSNAAER